jgi:transposase
LLLSRLQLVNMRRDASNQVLGALKVLGIVGAPAELSAFVEPLLAAWRSLGEQGAVLDRHIRKIARESPIVKNLTSVPGVGVLIAWLTLPRSTISLASRNLVTWGASWPRAATLSVRRDGPPGIDIKVRRSTAASLLGRGGGRITRTQRWSTLKAWGVRLAQRIGASKAKIAVARKLAIILHRMWRTGESFRWGSIEEATA